MQITVVPSSAGAAATTDRYCDQHLTSILVNERLAIDAGSLGFFGSVEDQAKIRHIIITHSHIDHLASLPIFLDNVFGLIDPCVTVHGCKEVLDCLRNDIFNDRVWPDFISLSKPGAEFIRLSTIEPLVPFELEGLKITPIPVDHVVTNIGLIIEEGTTAVAIPSDTGPTELFWEKAREIAGLKAVFIEASFPNDMEWLAHSSKHLTPAQLAGEVAKLGRDDVQWLAVHLKARYRETVADEIVRLGLQNVVPARMGTTYIF